MLTNERYGAPAKNANKYNTGDIHNDLGIEPAEVETMGVKMRRRRRSVAHPGIMMMSMVVVVVIMMIMN